ncbi:TP53-binding protein 1 isoform X1 [Gadus morhua]|uniref:TP53-binding protein 1 n=1 Tax=Gadus morhua TaxID=8049 RepID=A0A8C5CEF0_GADMO|nr:TP53-binding protein 1 isoform X1 [Gadus morhua]XP_030232985.1 TP53-binding protein 1 isoform X1 [Gadus morhua]XP_030232986.1 TP53-binding protein 1 isoform X1 [Gadus morhua]
MDPGGRELESSLPLHENPCLIVEDSQPDGVALDDDPESSYRALLSRRLSHLQPAAHSPVLELIASPAGSRCSQTTDSQSEVAPSNCGPAPEGESQVINICPLPNKAKCPSVDVNMDSGADSTTHCPQPEEGQSQFAGLELSESQGPGAGGRDSQQQDKEAVLSQTEQERHSQQADQKISTGGSADQDLKSARSEVSSSSSSEPCGQTDRALRAQALLHSQGRSVTGSHGDDDILSSQEDMFDAEKTGTAVDSTVADNQTHPTLTPAHTLGLLHFSGQGTLVQETLSQNSTDCVAPTPEHFSQAPLIVPNSPTNPECNMDADEPMDTSQPPEDQSMEREGGPSQIAAFSKPLPKASTPLSQNSPSFVLDRTLSMPSQPEFSHDVFAPTPSPEGGSCSGVAASQEPQGAAKAAPPSPSLPRDKPPPAPEPPAFTLALQLTVNTQSAVDQPPPPPEQQEEEEDSQATQIEEPLCVDESQSVRCSQRSDHGAAASSQRNAAAVAAGPDVVPAGSQRRSLDRAAGEDDSRPSQKSDAPARAAVGSVNVAEGGGGTKEESGPRPRPTADSGAAAERPLNAAPCTVSAQPALPQAADGVNVAKGPGNAAEPKAAAAGKTPPLPPSRQDGAPSDNRQNNRETLSAGGEEEEEEEESMEEEEVTIGRDGSALGLALSQSQLPSPEPMEEEEESRGGKDEGVTDGLQRLSERHSQASQQSKSAGSQPACSKVSTNGHRVHPQTNDSQVTPDRLSQKDRAGPEADGPKDKSLSDSSGEIPFNFTLPKEGDLIGPAVVATPPLVNQLKQTPRHSTPIEINSFSEKPPAVGDVSAATSDIVAEESGEEGPEKEGGKLSLRMRLVTPVEEGSSERFSLQKPSLSEEDASVVKVTTVAKAVTSSSVFSRVRQVHRQVGATEEEARFTTTTTTPSTRSDIHTSPLRSSQSSSLGCNSLPNSQSEPSSCPSQEALADPLARADTDPKVGGVAAGVEGPGHTPGPSTPHRPGAALRTAGTPQSRFDHAAFRTPSSKRTISQQTSFDGPLLRSPTGRPYAESPPFQRAAAPSHRRHVRTTQEVRTTVTRIITDVYYEDGKEVDRKVTEENEEPVVDCQVLDSDLSPCRTASSMTSGDLGDVSSLSSKLSGGTTGSGGTFAMPPSRGGRASSPRRGGGPRPRGQRGQRAGSAAQRDRGEGPPLAPALVPLPSRGRARRGRPPSRSSLTRGAAWSAMQRVSGAGPPGQHQLSSSEEEPPPAFARVRLPVSPPDAAPPSLSDSLRSSPEQAGSAGGGGSSFVGLRVVAKWSSNAYFYPGRITKDAGEGRFGLRFDDGYECEVSGGDILLCDPVPAGTEVTALLEEEYFSVGVVKGHKTEGQELYYSVEREGQSQWHSRSSVILSLEQGNRLREQHSLGPYEPASPLAKASDISLDNLVEGKRRRRGGAGGQGTPTAISSGNPRTPGPSGKRKLMSSTEERTPAKRGRRGGGGGRAAQRLGVCNTSGSGTDLPAGSGDMEGTHGPLPQNASLFLGFAFMLTASSETDRLTNKLAGNDDEEYVQTAPYNKGYTESQLQAGGGFVLLDFNEEQCKAAYQSLLIADQHCRTRKYLLCVASGVPCVSHIWVHDCCKDNKLLNYRNYLLPAGMGPDEQIVEWHPRCKPFEALRVLLVFGESEELWVQLLTLSGALTVRHYQAEKDGSDIPAGKFDVVVTDGDCPLPVEKSAASQKLPLVSAEWLIQSLICGERLGYRSKPQYQHDYSSSTTTTLSSSTSS